MRYFPNLFVADAGFPKYLPVPVLEDSGSGAFSHYACHARRVSDIFTRTAVAEIFGRIRERHIDNFRLVDYMECAYKSVIGVEAVYRIAGVDAAVGADKYSAGVCASQIYHLENRFLFRFLSWRSRRFGHTLAACGCLPGDLRRVISPVAGGG